MPFVEVPGVDQTPDTFTFAAHGLNCFWVPKYLATHAFGLHNRELYYTYLYFLHHYDAIPDLHRDDREPYILGRKLGLELVKVPAGPNLIDQICTALHAGCPVLVPINREDLFYVRQYRQGVHPHCLLVKGYNLETEIFVILDCEQNTNLLESGSPEPLLNTLGSVYSEFYLPFGLVEELLHGFSAKFSLPAEFQFMRRCGSPTITHGVEALKDLLVLIQPYEKEPSRLLKRKLEEIKRISDAAGRRHVNTQIVLAKTLSKLLCNSGVDPEAARSLEEAGLAAWEAWKDLTNHLMLMRARNSLQEESLDKWFRKVEAAEFTFIGLLCRVASDY